MSSSIKAQNRNKAGTSSKAQLIGGTFRFTIANVSQLVKTTSTPVTIAVAKFRCLVSRADNQLQIAVTAEGNYGVLEAEVEVSAVNQKDPEDNITYSKEFTFKKDAILQWPNFAKWDQLFAVSNGGDGWNDKGDGGDDADGGEGGGARAKRKDTGEGGDKGGVGAKTNGDAGGDGVDRDAAVDEDSGDEEVGQSGGFVTSNDSMDILVCIMSADPRRKKERSTVVKGAAEKGKKTGAAVNAHGRETVGEGKVTNEGTAVASSSGYLKKVTWADNMQAAPQNALPTNQKHIANQFTQTEMKVASHFTQTEMKVASQFTQTEMKVASHFTQTELKVAHQFTQTEDDGLFSSKINVSTISKAFECQVCYSLFQPPISLCSRGHSFCSGCKRDVQQCPTCEAKFPKNARNFALEGIMDYVLYSCSEVACPVMCLLSEREKHKLECKKRQVLCRTKHLQQNVPCIWNGPLDQFNEHCIASHREKTILIIQDEFTKMLFPMKSFDNGDTLGLKKTRSLDGKIFTINLYNYSGHFYACVRMFGTQSEAKQFTCEMRLASQDPAIGYQFQTSFQVHCDLEKQHGKYISLSTLDVIQENGLIDDDGNLTISVRIFRK